MVSCVRILNFKIVVYKVQLSTCLPGRALHMYCNVYTHRNFSACLCGASWASYSIEMDETEATTLLLVHNTLNEGAPVIPSNCILSPYGRCPSRYVFRLGFDLVHLLLWLAAWHDGDELACSLRSIHFVVGKIMLVTFNNTIQRDTVTHGMYRHLGKRKGANLVSMG